jgi:hypothetical protein
VCVFSFVFSFAYETSSRIDTLTDAQGKVINFDYEVPTRSETITDQVGTPATIALDPRGNLTRAIGGTGSASGCAADGKKEKKKEDIDLL